MALEELDKESFIHMAKMHGLDPNDPHLDEVYPWVKETLKAIERLDELDLAGVEPDLLFVPGEEE